jgi:probable HAF family extracellular repeat protein
MQYPKTVCTVSILMKANPRTRIAAILLGAALTAATPLAAQQPRYRLVYLGTLGGPHSYGGVNGPGIPLLNNSGIVGSFADTAIPDPLAPGCDNCFLAHAFRWKDGVMTDLGALPGVNFSAAGSTNARGWMAGQSYTSTTDPNLGIPEIRAVLWKNDGHILDLGVLPGGTESLSVYVNDAGQVVGFSDNGVPDTYSLFFPTGTQTRTFLWEHGSMHDIGTLGGASAVPGVNCSDPGPSVLVGMSYINDTPNPLTGIPTIDPFLWDHGKMTDLGTLGGAWGFGQCANSRHQIIGQSSLAESPTACRFDQRQPGCHAFLWKDGHMQDLGTLGGPDSEAQWINESGLIAGSADFAGGLPGVNFHDAVIWENGKIKDLGTVDGDACSRAYGLNARGQVVGTSTDCTIPLHAFLWEKGGPMLDLNTLIPPGSGWVVANAFEINDRGEILAEAAPVGDIADREHLVLLVPCKEHGSDCENSVGRPESLSVQDRTPRNSQVSGPEPPGQPRTPQEYLAAWRARFARQYHRGEH